jgi:hypothetical protein
MRTLNNPTRYNFEMAILQRKPFNVTLIQPPAFESSSRHLPCIDL